MRQVSSQPTTPYHAAGAGPPKIPAGARRRAVAAYHYIAREPPTRGPSPSSGSKAIGKAAFLRTPALERLKRESRAAARALGCGRPGAIAFAAGGVP